MVNRRRFLGSVAGALSAAEVKNPRATSGDPEEPNWAERMTVTVGPGKADLVGSNERVLQAAVDLVTRWGGGTVKILPGTYKLRNAVYLHPKLRIVGSGTDSVLIKEPSIKTKLGADSDWYDQEITLDDAKGFEVGDGVCLRAKNPDTSGKVVIKRTLVARSGNRFKLDRALRENLWVKAEPTAETLFPLLSGENIAGVTIENLALDGNRANNGELDGNYAGCIWLQDCNDFRIRNVIARNYHGDGISWQVSHDVTVEGCHSHDHSGLGLHPGSGSQRAVIRRNRMERNDQGLYFCWGVKYGRAERNVILDSRRFGISIGHRDTDNVVRDNEIRGSGEVGILFRNHGGRAFQPHRNRIENNTIVDVGKEWGMGIDIQGETEQITIKGNTIRETAGPLKRLGIRIGAQAGEVTMAENKIEGFSAAVMDLRKKS